MQLPKDIIVLDYHDNIQCQNLGDRSFTSLSEESIIYRDINKTNNSWLLPISHSNKLHDDILALCRCGFIFKISYMHMQKDTICCCPQCANTFFINSTLFVNKITQQQIFETLNCEIEQCNEQDSCTANAYIMVPGWDIDTQWIIYRKFFLMSFTLSGDHVKKAYCQQVGYISIAEEGYHKPIPLQIFLQDMLYDPLVDYLLTNSRLAHPSLLKNQLLEILTETGKQRFDLYAFFIAHPYYDNLELYYWDKIFLEKYASKNSLEMIMSEILLNQSKAVRRIFFAQYKSLDLLTRKKTYDPSADYCIMRNFQNTNYVQCLIKIPYRIKQQCINSGNHEEVQSLIDLLKQFYSETKIVKFFISLFQKTNHLIGFYNDLLRFFSIYYLECTRAFYLESKQLSVKGLHDELVISYNRFKIKKDNAVFSNINKYANSCMVFNGLKFSLATSSMTLQQWGNELHNCLACYSSYITSGSGLIYGVFIDDILTYAINISSQFRLIEAKAKYNKPVPLEHCRVIMEWLAEQRYNYLEI